MLDFPVYDPQEIFFAMANTVNADDEPHPKFTTDADLTPAERRIFDMLADGEIHKDAEILEMALGRRFAASNTVAIHMSRIREKIAGEQRIIREGAGYVLRAAIGRP